MRAQTMSTLALLLSILGCGEVPHLGYFDLATCESAECRSFLESPLDCVQFKAAHNSIDRRESLTQQLQWKAEEPFQSGCRGIELDLVQRRLPLEPSGPWEFVVQHGLLGMTSRDFRECLRELRLWSTEHKKHDLVIVHLDIKSFTVKGDDSVFPQKLDETLEQNIGRDRMYVPGDLTNSTAAESDTTLLAGANKGWPTLGMLSGRFLFIISGDETNDRVHQRKSAYASMEPTQRLAFVDIDQRLPRQRLQQAMARGDRVVLNLHFGSEGWQDLVVQARRNRMVSRIWVANSRKAFESALSAGVNIVSTDKVRGHSWAAVGPLPYRLRKKG